MNQKKILNYWETNFNNVGLDDERLQLYKEYISVLIENQVPIIFDFNHLCLLLGKNRKYLASVINSNTSHYRDFRIPKRSGGHRTITAPYPALKECQEWIYKNILTAIKIHPCAHGFAPKKSIVSNAKLHLGRVHFLKMDMKDFFPTITINRVISVFKRLGYTNKVSFYLASICCYGNILPQGAPTSPVLSNIIASSLDKRLYGFAKKNNLRYSRYADDLAFSGDNIPKHYVNFISNIIKSSGFVVNPDKTRLKQSKSKRILTGISISDETLRLPREYKRELRKEIHCIQKFGLISHIRNQKIKNPKYLVSLIGKFKFWLLIEPENVFARKSLELLTFQQEESVLLV